MTPNSNLLDVNELEVGYGDVSVVKGINFTIKPAEIVCLLGANGVGKTTTLMGISGLLPFTGEIQFKGESIKNLAPDVITRKGLVQVPEDRSLFGALTVRENLQVASRDKEDLDRVINYFPKLAQIIDRRASVLSGGEQQMLALARALALQPKILLVDEMSLGLAPLIVEGILPVFREIVNETKCSILMVEQHVHLALEVADRAYVMSRGRIVGEGTANSIAESLEDIQRSYLGESPQAQSEERSEINYEKY